MGVQLLPVPSSSSIDLYEAEGEMLSVYSSTGALVGRIQASAWEIGDLDVTGLRTTLDPAGGLRFRADLTSELLNLVDQQGMSIRDAATGIIVSELSREKLRLIDPTGGNDIVLSTVQAQTLATPRYTGVTEIAPSNTVVVPAANRLTTNDLELSHVAAFNRTTVQAATWTPPAGWTEVIDNDYGIASTLATSVASRGPATGTTGTFTSTQTNWDEAAGTHIIVRGTPGAATPTVRSTTQLEATTSGSIAKLNIVKPAGVVAGDVLVIFVTMGNSGGSVPVGWVTPQGWVYLGAQVSITGTGTSMSMLAVGVWAKLAGASEPSIYETTINFGVGAKTMHVSMVAVMSSESTPAGQQFNVGGYNLAGPWRSYQPATTNINTGTGGTVTGRYLVMGKTCFVQGNIRLGTGGVLTASPPSISVPFSQAGAAGALFTVFLADASPFTFRDGIGQISEVGANVFSPIISATGGFLNNNTPWTWAVSDQIQWSGVYEID